MADPGCELGKIHDRPNGVDRNVDRDEISTSEGEHREAEKSIEEEEEDTYGQNQLGHPVKHVGDD